MLTWLAVASTVFVSFMAFMMIMYKRNNGFSAKSKKVLDMFHDMEVKLKKGIAVYTPSKEEIELFEKMADKGMLKRNPMSTGGYILSDSFRMLWKDDINASDVVRVRTTESIKEELAK